MTDQEDRSASDVIMMAVTQIEQPTEGFGKGDKVMVIMHHTDENGDSGVTWFSNFYQEYERLGILRHCIIRLEKIIVQD